MTATRAERSLAQSNSQANVGANLRFQSPPALPNFHSSKVRSFVGRSLKFAIISSPHFINPLIPPEIKTLISYRIDGTARPLGQAR